MTVPANRREWPCVQGCGAGFKPARGTFTFRMRPPPPPPTPPQEGLARSTRTWTNSRSRELFAQLSACDRCLLCNYGSEPPMYSVNTNSLVQGTVFAWLVSCCLM